MDVFNTNKIQKLISNISKQNNETQWFFNYRLKNLKILKNSPFPKIERLDYSNWNLWQPPVVTKNVNSTKTKINYKKIDSEVIVINFNEAQNNHEELFKKIYEESNFNMNHDFFNAFTSAFLTSGTFIYIPEDMIVNKPIEISNFFNNSMQKSENHQVLIYADINSSAEIIEDYYTHSVDQYKNINIHIDIIAKSEAIVQYTSLNHFDKYITSFIRRTAKTEKNAVIDLSLGVLNEGNTVEDIYVSLDGEGSTSNVKTISLCDNKQIQAVNVNVVNNAPHTIGNIFQHGVALDQSTVTFNGIGRIINKAKDSDAQQESRVLLLSDKARADTNPILLIDEYEVEAGHAASVTRTNQDQLYYLMSRGLTEKEAEKLIIRGFLGIVLAEISKKEVRQEFVKLIERKLSNYDN